MNRFLPEVPKNVRGVIFGIEYPMKLSYVGMKPEGHLWQAHWPEGVETPTWEQFDGMRMDSMPAHTGIACEIRET